MKKVTAFAIGAVCAGIPLIASRAKIRDELMDWMVRYNNKVGRLAREKRKLELELERTKKLAGEVNTLVRDLYEVIIDRDAYLVPRDPGDWFACKVAEERLRYVHLRNLELEELE